MMVGFGLFWLLVLAAVVVLVLFLVRKPGGSGWKLPGDSAEEILRQRYARGEINREEYEDRLRELRR